MAITYTITEAGAVMTCTSAADVAQHVVLAGATYTVHGTPEEQVRGTRVVEEEIQKLRSAAQAAANPKK